MGKTWSDTDWDTPKPLPTYAPTYVHSVEASGGYADGTVVRSNAGVYYQRVNGQFTRISTLEAKRQWLERPADPESAVWDE